MDEDSEYVDDELVELFTEIIKHQFKAAEKSEQMVAEYDVNEINASASVAVEDLHERFESEERKRRLYLLVAKIGKNIGSESMAEFGVGKLREAMPDEQ